MRKRKRERCVARRTGEPRRPRGARLAEEGDTRHDTETRTPLKEPNRENGNDSSESRTVYRGALAFSLEMQ